jgi:hypothetical protein
MCPSAEILLAHRLGCECPTGVWDGRDCRSWASGRRLGAHPIGLSRCEVAGV